METKWAEHLVAAIACVLAITVGAALLASPILRDYLGGGAGYDQSATVIGHSVTESGWTMTITDCVGDDRRLYLGLVLTAPDGVALDHSDAAYKLD